MLCPSAVRTTERNAKSVEVCRTPRGKNNSGSPNTMEDRSTGGLALPAVPPTTVREPHTDSHRTGVRWDCKPEISNAEQTGGLRRTRIFDSLDSGVLRVNPEGEVNGDRTREHALSKAWNRCQNDLTDADYRFQRCRPMRPLVRLASETATS